MLRLLLCLFVTSTAPTARDSVGGRADGLNSTEPVRCRKVDGFRDYVELDPAELTRDEKLIVYYEPSGFKVDEDSKTGEFFARLVQDVRIRKKGVERPLREEKGFLEYEPRSKQAIGPIYLSSSFTLKELGPGDYEVEMILRDALDEAKPPLKQKVSFTVINSKVDR